LKVGLVSALYPPDFRGGATLVCENLAADLADLGQGCAVFAGRTTAAEPEGAVVTGRVGAAGTYAVNVGGALHSWSPLGYWNPVASRAFADFCRIHEPDVVHIHSLQGLGAGLLGVARDAGAAVVVTMHDWWWQCPCLFRLSPRGGICDDPARPAHCSGVVGFDFARRRSILAAALRDADRLLVPSDFLRESLVAGGFERSRIEVSKNGVARPQRDLSPVGAAEGAPLRFLYVGGAGNRAKGLEVLLRAVALLEGNFLVEMHSVEPAEIEGFEDERLRCRSSFGPEERDAVFERADVVVVPSVMRESFSLVAHEALLRGRPVLVSDCGGPQEVVRDGENGIVVPSADPAALAAAMDGCVRDRSRVRRLASAPPPSVASPREHAETTLALYRDLRRVRSRPAHVPGLAGRKILFLTGMDGAPLRYRAWNLIERLGPAGMDAEVLYHSDARALAAAERADVVILYRAPLGRIVARVVERCRVRGVPVIFSSDDLVFHPADLAAAPALDHPDPGVVAGYRESVEGHARALAASDAFLGSTPELAAAAEEMGLAAFALLNGPSSLLLGVSERAMGSRCVFPGRVRVGYASGTDTHDGDLALVAPALAELLGRRPEVDLVLVGPVEVPARLQSFAHRIERRPFVGWSDLPECLAGLDVNLAPLDIGRAFNRAKSEVKFLEAAAVGVPTLASASPAFERASRGGEIGMLAEGHEEWLRGLERLVDDAGLREALGGAARRDVIARYGCDAQAAETAAFVAAVLERGSGAARPLPEVIELEAESGSEVALEPGDALLDAYQFTAERGGPLLPDQTVEQSFECRRDGLRRIDLRVGTYVRRNQHDVEFTVLDDADRILARKVVGADRFVDRRFVSVELDQPWMESASRRVRIRVEAPGATPDNAILLWHAPCARGGLKIGGIEHSGRSLSFRSFSAPGVVG
jgi:glycosyltransferase involved in cell wall biosynthesis